MIMTITIKSSLQLSHSYNEELPVAAMTTMVMLVHAA